MLRITRTRKSGNTAYVDVSDERERKIYVSMTLDRDSDVTTVRCETCTDQPVLGIWEGFRTLEVPSNFGFFGVIFDGLIERTFLERGRVMKIAEINRLVNPVVAKHFAAHYPD